MVPASARLSIVTSSHQFILQDQTNLSNLPSPGQCLPSHPRPVLPSAWNTLPLSVSLENACSAFKTVIPCCLEGAFPTTPAFLSLPPARLVQAWAWRCSLPVSCPDSSSFLVYSLLPVSTVSGLPPLTLTQEFLVTGLPAFPPPSPITLCPFSSQDPGGPCENLSQTLLPSCSPPQELPAAPLLGAALCPGVCRALVACATCSPGPPVQPPLTCWVPAQGLHSLPQTHQSQPSHTVFSHRKTPHAACPSGSLPASLSRFSVAAHGLPSPLCTSAPPQLVVHHCALFISLRTLIPSCK